MTDDLFDTVRTDFLSKDDINNCLIALIATGEPEMRQSSTKNEKTGEFNMYEFIPVAIVVIDGRTSEAFEEEHGKTLPVLVKEFGISGAYVIDKAKKTLQTGRPVLMRMKAGPNNNGGKSYKPIEPTDADVNKASDAKLRPLLTQLTSLAFSPFDSE